MKPALRTCDDLGVCQARTSPCAGCERRADAAEGPWDTVDRLLGAALVLLAVTLLTGACAALVLLLVEA